MLGAQSMASAPGVTHRDPGFDAPKPHSRPTPELGRGGPVVLKGCGNDELFSSTSCAAAALGDAGATSCLATDSSALAGPTGAASAGATPTGGVLGRLALEQLAGESYEGDAFHADVSGPPRTDAERRRAALEAKRRDLVESRLRPQPPAALDATEPRPPSQPRPDPRLSLANSVSPRSLEVDGSGLSG